MDPLAAGDAVYLVRPDGGPANVLEAWKIDAIVDSDDGPLAIFVGRPYASWPLSYCRRAREVSYPPARRGTALSTYALLREAERRARQDEHTEPYEE